MKGIKNISQGKKRHKFLSLKDKCELLKMLSEGVSVRKLTEKYGVAKSTICRLKKNEDSLRKFIEKTEIGLGKRMTLRSPEMPKMEKLLFDWFMRERGANVEISTEMLCEKAKYFNEIIKERAQFSASPGWVSNFRKRYGLRSLKVPGEKSSFNEAESLNPFLFTFHAKILELNFSPDQIYNANESNLFWRLFPKSSTLVHFMDSTSDQDTSKNRITFVACTNAAGSHNVKPFIIGQTRNSSVWDNLYSNAFMYKDNKNACMTLNLFKDWMEKCFAPEVSLYLQSKDLPKKALLLIENAPYHPKDLTVEINDLMLTVMCVPSSCTSLLKPINQIVAKFTKLYYKTSLLAHVVGSPDFEKSLKDINLKHVICFLSNAWKSLSSLSISNYWKKILPQEWGTEYQIPKSDIESQIIDEILPIKRLLCNIFPSEVFTDMDIIQWIDESNIDTTCTENSFNEESKNEIVDKPEINVNLNDVITSFDTCLKWAIRNGTEIDDLIILQKLREKAILESSTCTIQTNIERFL